MNLKEFIKKHGTQSASIAMRTAARQAPPTPQGAAQFKSLLELAEDLQLMLESECSRRRILK